MPLSAKLWLGQEVPPPPHPDVLLAGEEDLEIVGLSAKVLHTPGHTPGSLSLYVPDADLLFSGDTLFRESIGRTDLPGGNYERIIRSISEKLLTLPDHTRVLPGHMQETTIAHERARNPFVANQVP
jgi:glyoxylase-like metal-dependent hydrolase (beta-lactamase superfamily II)